MAWLKYLDVTPSFPRYSGPYEVGSVDVEVPVATLDSPSPAPTPDIGTVAFRIFYPCESGASQRPVQWLPSPQRSFLGAYAKFIGANAVFANIFSLFLRQLYFVKIPVHRNAQLRKSPNSSGQWPVIIFSHGLGGSRNLYSYLLGSLASYGVVVVAPDHRDGSAPISFIRSTETTDARTIDYVSLPHKNTQEVFEGRDQQLKVRLWELGLVHDALLRMHRGENIHNLDSNSPDKLKKERFDGLPMFKGQLDVERPGAITWAGHSFGAASVTMLFKSTFWRSEGERTEDGTPLFTPSASSSLAKQITSHSNLVLYDPWFMPLESPTSQWLKDRPLPCYADEGPGGTALLTILSEQFHNWASHLEIIKRTISENPSSWARKRGGKRGPRFFYPAASAHLSQSDFGLLFPWLSRQFVKAEEPERILRLNIWATLQLMRESGAEVASAAGIDNEKAQSKNGAKRSSDVAQSDQTDGKIWETNGGVRGWIAVPLYEAEKKDAKTAPQPEDEMKGPLQGMLNEEVIRESA